MHGRPGTHFNLARAWLVEPGSVMADVRISTLLQQAMGIIMSLIMLLMCAVRYCELGC